MGCPPVCSRYPPQPRPPASLSPANRRSCGATHGPATRAAAGEYALPRGREQADEADGKKRPAVVLAEALRAALASTPAGAGSSSRGSRR